MLVNFEHARERVDSNRWPELARCSAAMHVRPSLKSSIDEERRGAHFLATDPELCIIGGSIGTQGNPAILDPGQTYYTSLLGGGDKGADITRATGKLPYALTASKLTVYLYHADTDCATTCTLLHKGSTSALVVCYSAGQSGWLTDNLRKSDRGYVNHAWGNSYMGQCVCASARARRLNGHL